MDELLLAAALVLLGATTLRLVAATYCARRRFCSVPLTTPAVDDEVRNSSSTGAIMKRNVADSSTSGWQGLRRFYVARKVMEAEGACSLYLKPYDGKRIPIFVPGQHLTLQVDLPGEDKPLSRCYSLSDAPFHQDQYRITVKRIAAPQGESQAPDGAMSSVIHDTMDVGTKLSVRSPTGSFYLNTVEQRPIVFIAAGIGITPILSMLKVCAALKEPDDVWLFYGVRNRAQHTFHDEIKRISESFGQMRQISCYSEPDETSVQGRNYQRRGRISMSLLKSLLPHKDYVFYICGPSEMMETLVLGLRAWGIPTADIRTEAFGRRFPPNQSGNNRPQQASSPSGTKITFRRSNRRIHWEPGCRVLLDLAESHGVNLSPGCRNGQCGSCMVAIAKGRVRHIGRPGIPLAKGYCLPCIAVPDGDAVLEG